MNRTIRKRVGLSLAAVAAGSALLFSTTGCHRVCHNAWYHDSGPGCVWVK